MLGTESVLLGPRKSHFIPSGLETTLKNACLTSVSFMSVFGNGLVYVQFNLVDTDLIFFFTSASSIIRGTYPCMYVCLDTILVSLTQHNADDCHMYTDI